MLQSIRNLVTGWVAVLFVIILIIPFAFFGINYYFDQSSIVVAGTINGTKLSLTEYQTSYQNVRQQWQEINPDLASQEEFVKQQTLDSLINRELLSQISKDLGLIISDQQMRNAIIGIQAFQGIDGFENVLYQNYLATIGSSAASFESKMKEDLALQQLQTGLLSSTFITRPEITRIITLINQTRDIEYATVRYEDIKEAVEVTDDEVRSRYETRSQEYMEPERIKIGYLTLSLDQIAQTVTTDEESIRAFFENNKESYGIAERRNIKQILISATGEQVHEAIVTSADEIHDLVVSSKTFEEIESLFSDRKEISVEVSNFGFLNEGVLDPLINEAAFSMQQGEISKPILSEYGYHILKLEEITDGSVSNFDDVRDKVEVEYKLEQAEKQFFDLYDQLATLTFEHPDTLEIAAEDLGLTIQESDFLTRIGASDVQLSHPKILSAAFSDDVLLDGINSDLIEIDTNQVIVLRLLDHRPIEMRPMKEVYDEIMGAISFEKGSEQTSLIGNKVIDSLNNGVTQTVLEEEYSIEWKQATAIKRDTTEIDREIVLNAFSADKPSDKPVIQGVALSSGDFVVLSVNAVNIVDPETVTQEAVQPVVNQIQQYTRSETWARIIEDMRESADIRINEDNL